MSTRFHASSLTHATCPSKPVLRRSMGVALGLAATLAATAGATAAAQANSGRTASTAHATAVLGSTQWPLAALRAFLPFAPRPAAPALPVATYFVDASSGGGAGTSWGSAFSTLTDALAVASSGDLIVVAEGTYTPYVTGNRSDTFTVPVGVSIEGGYLGTESPGSPLGSAQNTILSGNILGTPGVTDDVYHVITVYDPVPPSPVTKFRRLTIRDGNANAYGNNKGGGIFCSNVPVRVEDSYFVDNRATQGGGIGGYAGSIKLKRCTFTGNHANDLGGAVYAEYMVFKSYSCTFEDNDSDNLGGAIYARWTGALTSEVMNGKFIGNSSYYGGAAYLFGTDPYSAGLKFINCTFAENDANSGSAVAAGSQADSRIQNSILWGNTGSAALSGPHTVVYSDVEGGYTGNGNVDIDPLFSPNFHFREANLVDIGNDAKIPADELDLDQDGNTTEDTPHDLAGDARVQGTHVDLGCYEEQ